MGPTQVPHPCSGEGDEGAHNKELELTPGLAARSGEYLCRRSAQSGTAAQLNSSLCAPEEADASCRWPGMLMHTT